MCSAERGQGNARPMWVRIAFGSFLSFGLLFTFVGALLMFVTLRHNVNDYHDMLSRLAGDLQGEYSQCGGDASAIKACFDEDAETHGRDNIFMLITDAGGKVKVSCSHNRHILTATQTANPPHTASRARAPVESASPLLCASERLGSMTDACCLLVTT